MPSLRSETKDCWPIALRHLDPERHAWVIDYDANEYVVMLREFRVYMLTFRPTGERYVGVTEMHPRDRLSDHAITAFDPKRRKSPVQKAIAKHGVDAFMVETIGVANSISDALDLEKAMIVKCGTLADDGGLNRCLGGGTLGSTRVGYHYLRMYERGDARVVHRIPRTVTERKKKPMTPSTQAPAGPSLRLVED